MLGASIVFFVGLGKLGCRLFFKALVLGPFLGSEKGIPLFQDISGGFTLVKCAQCAQILLIDFETIHLMSLTK